MVVSFSIVPIGVGEELREYVGKVLDVVDKSGLPYKVGAMQTTVEGEEAEVMALVMQCHRLMAEVSPRVLTHIAIDERRGAVGRLEGKVKDVETVIGRKLRSE